MAFYDVVILADLHLGSEIARANEALELLNSLRFHRLILLGDIFCDLNFRLLNEDHWRLNVVFGHDGKIPDVNFEA